MIILLRLLIALIILAIYARLGCSIMQKLNLPVTFRSLLIYTLSGPLVGLLVLVAQATMLAEQYGHIGEELQIFVMFIVALLVSLVVSLITVKLSCTKRR